MPDPKDSLRDPSSDLLILTLRVLPWKLADGTPWGANQRIKQMLKVLLRRFGMRLVKMDVAADTANVKPAKEEKWRLDGPHGGEGANNE